MITTSSACSLNYMTGYDGVKPTSGYCSHPKHRAALRTVAGFDNMNIHVTFLTPWADNNQHKRMLQPDHAFMRHLGHYDTQNGHYYVLFFFC